MGSKGGVCVSFLAAGGEVGKGGGQGSRRSPARCLLYTQIEFAPPMMSFPLAVDLCACVSLVIKSRFQMHHTPLLLLTLSVRPPALPCLPVSAFLSLLDCLRSRANACLSCLSLFPSAPPVLFLLAFSHASPEGSSPRTSTTIRPRNASTSPTNYGRRAGGGARGGDGVVGGRGFLRLVR